MPKYRLPIPIFRLGQYSFTTPRLYLSESRVMMSLTTIQNLDEPILNFNMVSARIEIPEIPPFFAVIKAPSGDLTPRIIISSIRESVRDHYLKTRTMQETASLPLINRLIVDDIYIDSEIRLLQVVVSKSPASQRILPPDPEF